MNLSFLRQGTSYMTEIWFVGGSFNSNRIHRSKKDARQLQPFQIWTLGTGSCHISSPDGPIRLKFGLWLVLMIILVPYIHKKTARVAGTTLNLESTLTLTLLRRPLIKVGQMVSGHFLLTPWVVCNWFGPWEILGQTHLHCPQNSWPDSHNF